MRNSSRDLTSGSVTSSQSTGTGLYSESMETQDGAVDRTHLAIVWGGFLLGVVAAGIPTLVGIIYAYYRKGKTLNEIEMSHYLYAIQTFWRTVIWGIIGALLCLVAIGFVVLGIVALWYGYRCLKGAYYALEGKPMYPLD